MKRTFLVFILYPFYGFSQHMGTTTLEVKPMPLFYKTDITVKSFLTNASKKLNADQADWFYWTNYSRINPPRFWDSVVLPVLKVYINLDGENAISLKKDLYASQSLPLLIPNTTLIKVATDHAEALSSAKASPSHTTPNGNTFQVRMENANIKKCAGENISFGPPNTILALVLLYLDQGVSDLGHRKTLLSPKYTEMGVGISTYPNKQVLVIQDFACNQGS